MHVLSLFSYCIVLISVDYFDKKLCDLWSDSCVIGSIGEFVKERKDWAQYTE